MKHIQAILTHSGAEGPYTSPRRHLRGAAPRLSPPLCKMFIVWGLPIRSSPALALMFQHLHTSAPWLVNEVHRSIPSGGSDWLYAYAAIRAQRRSIRRHVSALVMLTDTCMMSPTGGGGGGVTNVPESGGAAAAAAYTQRPHLCAW